MTQLEKIRSLLVEYGALQFSANPVAMQKLETFITEARIEELLSASLEAQINTKEDFLKKAGKRIINLQASLKCKEV